MSTPALFSALVTMEISAQKQSLGTILAAKILADPPHMPLFSAAPTAEKETNTNRDPAECRVVRAKQHRAQRKKDHSRQNRQHNAKQPYNDRAPAQHPSDDRAWAMTMFGSPLDVNMSLLSHAGILYQSSGHRTLIACLQHRALIFKRPAFQRFQLNLDPWMQRIDPFHKMNINHAPVVHAKRLADHILRNL